MQKFSTRLLNKTEGLVGLLTLSEEHEMTDRWVRIM